MLLRNEFMIMITCTKQVKIWREKKTIYWSIDRDRILYGELNEYKAIYLKSILVCFYPLQEKEVIMKWILV